MNNLKGSWRQLSVAIKDNTPAVRIKMGIEGGNWELMMEKILVGRMLEVKGGEAE